MLVFVFQHRGWFASGIALWNCPVDQGQKWRTTFTCNKDSRVWGELGELANRMGTCNPEMGCGSKLNQKPYVLFFNGDKTRINHPSLGMVPNTTFRNGDDWGMVASFYPHYSWSICSSHVEVADPQADYAILSIFFMGSCDLWNPQIAVQYFLPEMNEPPFTLW